MNAFNTISTLWAVLGFAFVAVMVVRANLANHETDQLFLNDEDSISSTHQENDEVVRRINWITPICKGLGGVTAVLSLLVVGMLIARVVAG